MTYEDFSQLDSANAGGGLGLEKLVSGGKMKP